MSFITYYSKHPERNPKLLIKNQENLKSLRSNKAWVRVPKDVLQHAIHKGACEVVPQSRDMSDIEVAPVAGSRKQACREGHGTAA